MISTGTIKTVCVCSRSKSYRDFAALTQTKSATPRFLKRQSEIQILLVVGFISNSVYYYLDLLKIDLNALQIYKSKRAIR